MRGCNAHFTMHLLMYCWNLRKLYRMMDAGMPIQEEKDSEDSGDTCEAEQWGGEEDEEDEEEEEEDDEEEDEEEAEDGEDEEEEEEEA